MRICITRLYTLCRYPNTFLFEKKRFDTEAEELKTYTRPVYIHEMGEFPKPVVCVSATWHECSDP